MPKKLTTYNRPSIATQIANGEGTEREVMETYCEIHRRGASHKTLNKIRKAILQRFPESNLLLIRLENTFC